MVDKDQKELVELRVTLNGLNEISKVLMQHILEVNHNLPFSQTSSAMLADTIQKLLNNAICNSGGMLMALMGRPFVTKNWSQYSTWIYMGLAYFHNKEYWEALSCFREACQSPEIHPNAMDISVPDLLRATRDLVNSKKGETKDHKAAEENKKTWDGKVGFDVYHAMDSMHRAYKGLDSQQMELPPASSVPALLVKKFPFVSKISIPVHCDKLYGDSRRIRWGKPDFVAPGISYYHIYNPSIIPHPTLDKHFLVNLRAANYTMTPSGGYEYPKEEPFTNTRNWLCVIKESDLLESLLEKQNETTTSTFLKFTEPVELIPKGLKYKFTAQQRKGAGPICGLEDVRLVYDDTTKQLFGTATSLEATPNHCQSICLANLTHTLKKEVKHEVKREENIWPKILRGFFDEQQQKNWMFFSWEGQLFCIYSFRPLVVLFVDQQVNPHEMINSLSMAKNMVKVASMDVPNINLDLRGSSPLLCPQSYAREELCKLHTTSTTTKNQGTTTEKYYLALVHVSKFPRYEHRFVVLKLTPVSSLHTPFRMSMTHVSPSFYFDKWDVEFNCGMAFSSDERVLYVPYGVRDQDCFMRTFSVESVMASLLPLNTFLFEEDDVSSASSSSLSSYRDSNKVVPHQPMTAPHQQQAALQEKVNLLEKNDKAIDIKPIQPSQVKPVKSMEKTQNVPAPDELGFSIEDLSSDSSSDDDDRNQPPPPPAFPTTTTATSSTIATNGSVSK